MPLAPLLVLVLLLPDLPDGDELSQEVELGAGIGAEVAPEHVGVQGGKPDGEQAEENGRGSLLAAEKRGRVGPKLPRGRGEGGPDEGRRACAPPK